MKDLIDAIVALIVILAMLALAWMFTVCWTLLFAWIAMHVWNTGISPTFEVVDATYKQALMVSAVAFVFWPRKHEQKTVGKEGEFVKEVSARAMTEVFHIANVFVFAYFF